MHKGFDLLIQAFALFAQKNQDWQLDIVGDGPEKDQLAQMISENNLNAVISGFEPEDILSSVYLLCRQLAEGKSLVQNEYRRAVAPQGNPLARAMMEKCFEARRDLWRGLGAIEQSGLALRDELAEYDAEKKFGVTYKAAAKTTACRCGEVITGRLTPAQCPLFGKRCTPEDPVGPCMVSSEGACAAHYKYRAV